MEGCDLPFFVTFARGLIKSCSGMDVVLEYLRGAPIVSLFIIIALGFILGNIKIKGFSFDVSAVIFAALLAGHFGISLPPAIQTMGLVLFIFTVGIQAGPGFADSFRQHGRKYVLAAALLVLFSLVTAIVVKYTMGIPSDMLAGILCGALTSTPGLSVAIESTNSHMASIGYGIAYPIGVLGVIVFVKLMPRFLRANLQQEYEKIKDNAKGQHPPIVVRTYCVANAPLFGKPMGEVGFRTMTGATVSRIKKGNEIILPTKNTVLDEGDLLVAVGTEEAQKKVELLIGPQAPRFEMVNEEYVLETLLVTNKEVVNETLAKIQLEAGCRFVVTRIRRSGIDISSSPGMQLKFGDKVTVAAYRSDLPRIKQLLGNNARVLSDTDFFPIALGIVLGGLLGKVEISLGGSLPLSLGLTGGVLIMAILLSSAGKTGPILWTMTSSSNNLLRHLGLLLFLSGVGTGAGHSLVATIQSSGVSLLLIGAVLTLLPMILTMLFCHFVQKLNIFELFGVLTGGMTSTPGLAACESMAFDETPSMVYATVYPVAMVALLLSVKLLAFL